MSTFGSERLDLVSVQLPLHRFTDEGASMKTVASKVDGAKLHDPARRRSVSAECSTSITDRARDVPPRGGRHLAHFGDAAEGRVEHSPGTRNRRAGHETDRALTTVQCHPAYPFEKVVRRARRL